jgi:hypothetical protein
MLFAPVLALLAPLALGAPTAVSQFEPRDVELRSLIGGYNATLKFDASTGDRLSDGAPFRADIYELPAGFKSRKKIDLNKYPLLRDSNGQVQSLSVEGQNLYFGLGPKIANFNHDKLDPSSLCTRCTGAKVPYYEQRYGRQNLLSMKSKLEKTKAKREAGEPLTKREEHEERFFFGLIGSLLGTVVGLVTACLGVVVSILCCGVELCIGIIACAFSIVCACVEGVFCLGGGLGGISFGPVGCSIYPEDDWWPEGHCLNLPDGSATYGGCYTDPDDQYQVWDYTNPNDQYQVWEYAGDYYPVVTYNDAGQVLRWVPQN